MAGAKRVQLGSDGDGLYLLVQGASLWLDRYKTLIEPGDRISLNFSYAAGASIESLVASITAGHAPAE